MVALAIVAVVSLAGWVAVLLGTARAWDLHPIAEDEAAPAEPERWPSVCVLVPARNEAGVLPSTLPALLAQDYPGSWRVVLVDDRSTDGTAAAARVCGVEPIAGTALPDGWVGKVWALEQAAVQAHLDGCALCRREVEDLRAMEAALGEIPPEAFLDGPPPDGDFLLQNTLREVRRISARPPPREAACCSDVRPSSGRAVSPRSGIA